MSRVDALITPSVLRWAREQARLSIAEAADLIKRPPDEIQSWEDGSSLPSIAQARKASEVYRRPLAVFYLPEPPQDFDTLRDFRTLPNTEKRDYSPDLALLIRTTRYRQEWTRDFLLEEGVEKLDFVGSATMNNSPREIAQDILRKLNLSPAEQKKCNTRHEAFRLWMERSEAAGIFVFRQSDIPLKEARGFVISDDIAPFIFINSDDSKSAQIFTLAHELAHLWLDISGVSNIEDVGITINAESSQIETFCNRVAAEAVLEENAFSQAWMTQNPVYSIDERIQQISASFSVSEEVVARRLLERNIITQSKYTELREFYQDRWQELKKDEKRRMKASKGGPSYYVTTAAKNGYAFTQTVVGAFMGGSISGRDASSLLNAKINNFHRLGETVGIFAKAG